MADFYEGPARVLPEYPGGPFSFTSRPRHFFATLGPITLFDAEGAAHGWELWRTDGTAAGTYLVKDISPGLGSSWIAHLTTWNNRVYFFAQEGDRIWQLWSTDGTESGTRRVSTKQFSGDSWSSFNLMGTDFGLLIRSQDPDSAFWVLNKDGDLRPLFSEIDSQPFAYPRLLCRLPGAAILRSFESDEAGYFISLWITDGTASGTSRIDIIHENFQGFCDENKDYFYFGDPVDNTVASSLYRLKGSSQRTEVVYSQDLSSEQVANTGIVSRLGSSLLVLDGFLQSVNLTTLEVSSVSFEEEPLYDANRLTHTGNAATFIAGRADSTWDVFWINERGDLAQVLDDVRAVTQSASVGRSSYLKVLKHSYTKASFWYYEPGFEALEIVTDVLAGADDTGLFPYRGTLFPVGDSVVHRDPTQPRFFRELHKLSPSGAGSQLIRSTYEPVTGAQPVTLGADNQLLMALVDGRSDSNRVRILHRQSGSYVNLQNAFEPSFSASRLYGAEPLSDGRWLVQLSRSFWVTNGTPDGTFEVWRDDSRADPYFDWPMNRITIGSRVVFSRQQGISGAGFFVFEPETNSVAVLHEHSEFLRGFGGPELNAVNKKLLFVGSDGRGLEPWVTDGTPSGTFELADVFPGFSDSNPRWFVSFGDRMYFVADKYRQVASLWESDGTIEGTREVAHPSEAGDLGGVFVRAGELWIFLWLPEDRRYVYYRRRADGAFVPENPYFGLNSVCARYDQANPVRYTPSFEENTGLEFWRVNCVSERSALAVDLNPGPASASPREFRPAGDLLFFSATRNDVGRELFFLDTKTGKAGLVADVAPGKASSSPRHLYLSGSEILFNADDTGLNRELWSSPRLGVRALPKPCEEICSWKLILTLTDVPTSSVEAILRFRQVDREGVIRQSSNLVTFAPGQIEAEVFLPGERSVTVTFEVSDNAFALQPELEVDLLENFFTSSFEL